MKDRTCVQCKHFCQHYINKDARGYHPIIGHCLAKKRNRDTTPFSAACDRFEEIDKNEILKQKQKSSRAIIEKIEEKLTRLIEFLDN